MTEIQDVFARNVRKYRKAANLSQEKLAERASLHRTYIGGIEQRRVNVSLKNIEKIAAALEIDPAILLLSELPIKDEDLQRDDAPAIMGERWCIPSSGTEPEYALISWDDGQVVAHPIAVPFKDLTIQVLCALVLNGYKGKSLAKRYGEVVGEIASFLKLPFAPNEPMDRP